MNRVVKMIGYFRTAQSHCFFNKDLVFMPGEMEFTPQPMHSCKPY